MIQFYQTSNFKLLIFLFECSDQLFRILITLFFQFPDIPLGYWFYNRLEGIDIQILIRDDLDTILGLPSGEDLVVACAVDLALVLNSKFAALIDYFLLLRCQAVVNILVDAEEQSVIVCIPHGNVFLYFLYACRINRRKRVLLTVYRTLLQCRVSLGPVHVGRICAPQLVALHQKV